MAFEFTPEEKLKKAIIELQRDQPFFAMLAMAMSPRRMPEDYPMQTMGVDAKGNLYYSEKFVNEMGHDVMKGVVCHEVLHVALLHMARRGRRNAILSNVAQDVAVNNIVTRAGMSLPDGGIPVNIHEDKSEFELSGAKIKITRVSEKVWETIYEDVLAQLKQQGVDPDDFQYTQGWDLHMPGVGEDGEPLTEEELSKEQSRWRQQIAAAATYAKQQGKLPAGMERLVDEVLKPKMAWKALLLKYIKSHVSPVDWSYSRPHKKSQALEVFLPNTVKEGCEVEVLVDTSGSIGGEEMSEFLGEIVGIAKSMSHVEMWVSFCDTQIGARYKVDNGDIPKILAMKPVGGGGTSMEFGLDEIKAKNKTTPVVVVLTDGYDSYVKSRKDYPFEVIWTISERGISEQEAKDRIKYGLVVKMG